jgi:8-oxo-dGTP pyrophosphatase MutT (NUDIX family)
MKERRVPADPRLLDALAARLDPVGAPIEEPGSLRFAAVLGALLPAIDPAHGPRLLLIERAVGLRKHAGQLALPGGKPELHDLDLLDTALREAEEEVGLDRRAVEVLGRLAPVPTPTGFMIVPYVAQVRGAFEARPERGEVSAVLTPSLLELSDPGRYRFGGRHAWMGREYELHEFLIHKPPLWGATARIVYDLLSRLEIAPRSRAEEDA